ncbi:MAG: hypothetical protein M3Y07_10640 [Acidobacteriota bacterium]|nr:hypothetical protein [Acidobacteriota bacterium]
MTKVQIRLHLQKPLDDEAMIRLADANSIYGIQRVKVEPSLTGLTVDYDASRLKISEVENALAGLGIPAKLAAPTK